mmetsp:Transcript_43431/g.101449  ORF Transcript_43431/g.101449 Transcript_43431/m.101449 type:complete len:97 (-) Transcript_43431:273-563(-)
MKMVPSLTINALRMSQLTTFQHGNSLRTVHDHGFKVTDRPLRLEVLDQLGLSTISGDVWELLPVRSTPGGAHGSLDNQYSHGWVVGQAFLHQWLSC